MNHDRVKAFREKLDNLNITDYYGLKSPGLTCYLNSVLQVLFMSRDFREAIQRSQDSTAFDPHLRILFATLEKSAAKTHSITGELGITDVYEQHDAAEYFEKILRRTSLKASKIFKGELNHKTTCLQCKQSNDSRSCFWILPLMVKDSHHLVYSVEKGLSAFFKGEMICGDNKMYCSQCNGKQDVEIGCEITRHPDVLTLLLKRFTFDHKRKCFVKLHCNVDVPQTLHTKRKYDLYAIVNHIGSLTGGHYTADIRSFETGAWYHFSDDTVEMVKWPLFRSGNTYVRSHTAYLLMYRKDKRYQEEQCAHSDVEAEERREERGEALKDARSNEGKDLKHLNGDVCLKTYNELDKQSNQRVARQWLHKDMWPQTCADAHGDSYKPSVLTEKPDLSVMQKDEGHEANRQQLQASSKEYVCGTTMEHLLRNGHSKCEHMKKTLKANDRERQDNTVTETGAKSKSVTDRCSRNRVMPAEAKHAKNKSGEVAKAGIKQRTEADVSVADTGVKSSSSSAWSPPSAPHWRRRSHSAGRLNERTQYHYSPNLCRKSSSLKRNEEMQHSGCKLEATQTLTSEGKTASLRKVQNISKNKVKRRPWK